MLWTIKYAPKKISHICGNSEAIARINKWALSFSLKKTQKPLLIYGPHGCAKSACVNALATEFDWNAITIYPPQGEDVQKWQKSLVELLNGSSLFGNQNLVICEDIDDWHNSKIRGIVSKLSDVLKQANSPTIITCKDAYDRRVSSVRSLCEVVELKAINHSSLLAVLSKINQQENLSLSDSQLEKIALNSGGNLCACINDLQALNVNSRRENLKVQSEIIKSIFRSPTYKSTFSTDLGSLSDRSMLKLYTSENIPNELLSVTEMSNAYNFLSRSDVFDGRIMRRQYWGYLRYSSSLLHWGVSSCRVNIRIGLTSYSFPSYIRKMGATVSKRAIIKSVSSKIAPRCHCTSKHARAYVPLICAQFYGSDCDTSVCDKLCAFYHLDEEDLALLCEKSLNSINKPSSANSKAKKSFVKHTSAK